MWKVATLALAATVSASIGYFSFVWILGSALGGSSFWFITVLIFRELAAFAIAYAIPRGIFRASVVLTLGYALFSALAWLLAIGGRSGSWVWNLMPIFDGAAWWAGARFKSRRAPSERACRRSAE